MARTKDAVLTPEQKELMEKEYLDFVKPSTYGNKANPSSCDSLYDDVENPELRAIVEKVAATTPYREETSTNEAQSPPNPQKRISGKQRKATLEEYQQTFLQVPRIDDRKPVFVSSDGVMYMLMRQQTLRWQQTLLKMQRHSVLVCAMHVSHL